MAATLLISSNWYVFIHAVNIGEILQSSLGYFLVPIINVAIGILVFGEQPNRLKKLAIVVSAAGMMLTFAIAGIVPWLSLIMAMTFGLYGLVRKIASVDSALGLLLETAILLPLAAGYVLLVAEPIADIDATTRNWLWLLGIITVIPLLSMVSAARRIRMSTLGLLQYITPCLHYLAK
ncbi:MAG: protein RarD [Gammaproteobacteria bacterium]|nr:MAG: protein RarD [Gammaproteobacteria bacterium]